MVSIHDLWMASEFCNWYSISFWVSLYQQCFAFLKYWGNINYSNNFDDIETTSSDFVREMGNHNYSITKEITKDFRRKSVNMFKENPYLYKVKLNYIEDSPYAFLLLKRSGSIL